MLPGEYIGFVDSDDYVDENMFKIMYETANNYNLDFVECNFYWDFTSKRRLDIGKEYIQKEDYFINGRVMVCNKLFRTKIIKNNNLKFPLGLRYEDIEFFYKFIPYVKNSKLINLPLYFYVQRQDSITNYQNEKTADIFQVLNNILLFYKNNNLYNKYDKELEYMYIRFLLGSSFLRIVKIKIKKLRLDLLFQTWKQLNELFPNWKENRILKKLHTFKNIYFKTINKVTYKIYYKIFTIL